MTEITKSLSNRNAISGRTAFAALLASVVTVISFTVPHQALAEDKTAIKVGIISGEDEDVWRVVKAEAAKQGLTVETVVFNDYTQPNEALECDEIDANAFQHQLYLDNQIKTQGYHITPVGYTGLWPIGLYSKKHAKVEALPEAAVIGVRNDPSNEGRALRVLADAGLIKLKDGTGILATVADVVENPKKFEIKELDAAVVNTDWALKSGLTPENRIAQEPVAENPYRNFIAVKTGSENEGWVKKLVAAYQNPTVKAEFDRVYKGTGVAAY